MRIEVIAFTDAGEVLAGRVRDALRAEHAVGVARSGRDGLTANAFAQRHFAQAQALVFVGAAGIAVRSISPLLRGKTVDPAVLVLDEGGQWVVPVLGGHWGGANALARQLAEALGAMAVITTATDVRGVWAADEWAKAQGLAIADKSGIVAVSSALLEGRDVTLYCPWPVAGTPPTGVRVTQDAAQAADIWVDVRAPGSTQTPALWLVPRAVYVGVGCRRGVSGADIGALFQQMLEDCGIPLCAVAGAATVELKAEEPGLLAFCETYGLPLEIYTAAQLAALPGAFQASAFVQRVAGVDNVCERSAMMGRGMLLAPKTTAGGAAMALALKTPVLAFGAAEGEEQ